MTKEELAEEKLSEEEYKLAEEVIKPIYVNAMKNDYSFAKYGVECYLTGYNKANEWHYMKDGDLPKGEGAVLIYWKSGDMKCASVVEPYKVTEDTHIIAWKEIVLPELPIKKEIRGN